MKRLSKIMRLQAYLQDFMLSEYPSLETVRVVDENDATGKLAKASRDQMVIALPELRQSGTTSDSWRDSLSSAFFFLRKINAPSLTQDISDRAYNELLDEAEAVLDKLDDALAGPVPCQDLSGLILTGVELTPVFSVFGGWSGWSLVLGFE